MAKIVIKARKEAVEAAQSFGDFEDLRPGVYRFKIAEINDGYSKKEDGTLDKKRRRLEVIVRPVSMDREGKVKLDKNYGQLWTYISFSEASEQTRAMWAIALGGKPKANGDVEFKIETDPDKPGTDIGKEIIGRVKNENDLNGDPRPKLKSVFPINPPSDDTEEFEDDEEEADEGDAVEDPFADEEAEEEDELLSQDDLEAMDLKELGSLAKEFDLDPKDSLVKIKGKTHPVKTKARLIEAILEAQGDVDEDEGEEDPF